MKMVNVIVKKSYRDIMTGVTHKVGEKLTVTDVRFREINRREKHIEVVKEEVPENKKK